MKRPDHLYIHVIDAGGDAGKFREKLSAINCELKVWQRLSDLFASLETSAGPHILIADEYTLENFRPAVASLISGIRTIVLIREMRRDLEKRWVRLGCWGVLPADAPSTMLARSIIAVASDEIWASRQALSSLVSEAMTMGPSTVFTSRESEVLALLGTGRTNAEIAADLYISRETVRWHLRSIYRKSGVHGRKQAARMLVETTQHATCA